MLYFIYRVDKPHSHDLRMATRDAHLEYAKALGDVLVLAGPTMDDEGKMNGSVFLVEAADRATAEAISEEDPYEQAGLFESKIVRPFMQVIPQP